MIANAAIFLIVFSASLSVFTWDVSVFCQETEKKEIKKETKFLSPTRKNPFLTWQEEESLGREEREVLDYLTLSAIFHSSPRTKSLAVINGRILKEKDLIDNKIVYTINSEDVILLDSYGKEYVVRIKRIIDE